MMEKHIIYGLGARLFNLSDVMLGIIKNSVAFCDRDEEKQLSLFLGKPVISPEKISEYSYDKIVVTSGLYFNEIRESLIKDYHISESAIIQIDEYAKEEIELAKGIAAFKYSIHKKHIVSAGQLPQEKLQNCVTLVNREAALEYMPKNAVVCEVGVAYGDFSEKIIEVMNPKKFYAIDYFNQDDPYTSFWGRDLFRRDHMPHQQWYEHKFREEIKRGQVETRQGLSWNCLDAFPDDFFDYAYLDASHDYESVRRDIAVLKRKVKDGGHIQFNDYIAFSPPESIYYGVIPAVNEFIRSGNHKVVYFCLEEQGYNDIVVRVAKS